MFHLFAYNYRSGNDDGRWGFDHYIDSYRTFEAAQAAFFPPGADKPIAEAAVIVVEAPFLAKGDVEPHLKLRRYAGYIWVSTEEQDARINQWLIDPIFNLGQVSEKLVALHDVSDAMADRLRQRGFDVE